MRIEKGTTVTLLSEASPQPPVQGALDELQTHLEGLGLDVCRAGTADRGARAIGLGVDRRGEGLPPPEGVGREGFRLWSDDEHTVLISAGDPRGLLNGAYELLEAFGIRWLTVQTTYWPQQEAWDLSGLERTFEPAFRYRAIRVEQGRDPDWAARHRLNTFVDHNQRYFQDDPRMCDSHHFAGPDHYIGGKHCHNVYELLCSGLAGEEGPPPSVEAVFAEHPEYFTLLDGQRTWNLDDANRPDVSNQSGQLCLTHPRVRELLVLGPGDHWRCRAGAAGASVLLLRGRPIREPVVAWGPFVMNRREEIEEAIEDYRTGRLG